MVLPDETLTTKRAAADVAPPLRRQAISRGGMGGIMKITSEYIRIADLFPMMPDDELRELAEDIRTNGLQQPIVVDADVN